MAATTGIPAAALGELAADAQRYSLFAMLRALEQLHPQQPRLGESPRVQDDAVRVQQPPFLEFAPTDVASLQGGERHTVLEQYSFGMFGPNGALPLHLTEHAFERRHQFDDATFSDFVNLFQHRMATLFYRAWANSDPATNHDRPDEDGFRTYLGALIGLGEASTWNRDTVADHAKFSRVGAMGPHTRSAWGLEASLASYFGRHVRVRQFVGAWLPIPRVDRCRLGVAGDAAALGVGATIGESTWQCQQQFEIVVGPLRMGEFTDFLPGAPCLEELRDLVRLHTNDEWAWQVRLLLRTGEVPGTSLNGARRLGLTTWLGGRNVAASDVVLRGDSRAPAMN